jgi:hypothetical protein
MTTEKFFCEGCNKEIKTYFVPVCVVVDATDKEMAVENALELYNVIDVFTIFDDDELEEAVQEVEMEELVEE